MLGLQNKIFSLIMANDAGPSTKCMRSIRVFTKTIVFTVLGSTQAKPYSMITLEQHTII